MREDCRGFLLRVAFAGDFCFPKRDSAFRKIKMQVALRPDAMIMCRYSSLPSTPEDQMAYVIPPVLRSLAPRSL